MINFTQKPVLNKRQLRQVTAWVEDALPERTPQGHSLDDAMVMVNEMQCYEPDCAPLETVVSLLGQQSIIFKIFKPVVDVTPADVLPALEAAFQGTQLQHLASAATDPERVCPQ